MCTKYQIVELANALLVIVIERISVIAEVSYSLHIVLHKFFSYCLTLTVSFTISLFILPD